MKKILSLFLSLTLCVCLFACAYCTVASAAPDTNLPDNCVWYGDVNEDTFVDVTDIVMQRGSIVGKIAFSDRQYLIGDVDKNGAIDVVDIVMLRADVIKTASLGIDVGYSSYGYISFGTVTSDSEPTEPGTTPSTTKPSTTTTTDGPATKGFYVNGTKLLDANGNEFIMRGINVPYAWFMSNSINALSGISSLGANCVRMVLGEGSQYTKTKESQVKSIIQLCEKYGLVCVLEIHDFTGKNSESNITSNAVNYWLSMKDTLNYYKDTVIVNIANEWMSTYSQSTWESAYKTAVKSLRDGGLQNVLMIDAPGWGQGASALYNGAQSVLSYDKTGNTMFSIHMYSVAGGSSYAVQSNIDNTLNKGVCLVIGEFGHYQNGNVDWQTIMSHCQSKGVGWIAWSWKGNGGNDAVLDISSNWSGSQLTNWGNNVFYSTYGIKNTAKKCSIFN